MKRFSSLTFEDFQSLVLKDPVVQAIDRDIARLSHSKLSEPQDLHASFEEVLKFFNSSEQLIHALEVHRKEILANHETRLNGGNGIRLRIRKGVSIRELLNLILLEVKQAKR